MSKLHRQNALNMQHCNAIQHASQLKNHSGKGVDKPEASHKDAHAASR